MVVLLLFLGCSLPDNPGLPTWDTKLSFYMLNDSYDLLELADEDSSIVLTENAAGDTVLGIYQENTSEQDLEVGSTNSTNQEEDGKIGDIKIPDVDDVNGGISFGDFASAANLDIPDPPPPVSVVIPAFSFGDISIPITSVNEILWVEMMSGGFDLEITNNMIIGLGNYQQEDYLTLRLVHENNGGELENVIDPISLEDRNLDPGESYTESIDLAGIVIYRYMQLLISGGSRGTGVDGAVINLDTRLDTNISFWDNLTASSAESRIAEQSIEDTVNIAFDEDYRIYEAIIADNQDYQLSIYVVNGIDVALHFQVEIPEIYIDGINSFQADYDIPRSSDGGILDETLNLSGARIGNGIDLLSNIEIYLAAEIDSTDVDDYRLISYDDSYFVRAGLSGVEFEYIRGVIEPQDQDMISDEITLDLEYPEVEEGAQFVFVGDSEIIVDANTGSSQIPGDIYLDVRAYNTEDEMVQLINLITGELPHIVIPDTTNIYLQFTSDEYNINELLSLLPDRIEYDVQVTAGDGTSEVIFQQGDILSSNIIIKSTLSLAADAWVIPQEDGEAMIQEEEVELDQEQYNAFQSASLKLTYINTTGMEVAAEVLLSDNENNVLDELYNFDNPDMSLVDIIEIPGLETTSEGESGELEINLNQDDLSYFLNNITYVASRINLISEGQHALAGEVQLIGKAEIIIRISQDLIDNGEE